MTGMIPLDRVLREATDTNYRHLVTRPTGVAVRNRVFHVLRDHPRMQALLDFSRIGLLDFSCADEVVAKLLQAIHSLPITRVVLTGVRADHADAIDQALGRHGLTVLAIDGDSGAPRLLGEVPDDWRDAFARLLLADARHDAAGIAAHYGWPVGRAHQALEGLASCHCVIGCDNDCYELGALT